MEVQGSCEDGFEAVRDAFIQNFDDRLELGKQHLAICK